MSAISLIIRRSGRREEAIRAKNLYASPWRTDEAALTILSPFTPTYLTFMNCLCMCCLNIHLYIMITEVTKRACDFNKNSTKLRGTRDQHLIGKKSHM